MEYHRLDLVEQGLESFKGLDERSQECFLVINLQHNSLTTFEHFGTHPHLAELQLQHNRLQSFRGLTKQASLRILCLQGCPIASHPYYRLMALLTIGFSVEVVDGLPITSQERHVAKSLGKRAALAVSYGWLLDLRPRTVSDYEAIISDYKRLRKDERHRTQGQRCISVESVLAALSEGQKARGYDATTETQLRECKQTITRLARRVAQLEGQVAASSEGHVIPMLPPNQLEVAACEDTRVSSSGGLFSATELAQVDTVCFSRGVQMYHNLSLAQDGLQRVCVLLDHATLTVQTFLTRNALVQMPLRSLRVRHLRPLTLVVEDEVGGALGLVFESLPLLHTVYKALFVLSSRPVPPLSAMTQRQLQEMAQTAERQLTANAAITFSAPSAVESSSASRAASFDDGQQSGAKPTAAAATGSSSGAWEKPAQHSAAPLASVKLDNVEDVPPLPAAFTRMSTAGGTDSIVFSVEGQRPTAPVETAPSSPVLKSASNIDFHSVAPSNRGSYEAGANVTKPPEPPQRPPDQKRKLFANLMLNSSTSSDSLVFRSDGAKSEGEDSVVIEDAKTQAAAVQGSTHATPPVVPPVKAPPGSRPTAVVPPRPPQRRSTSGMPAASLPASASLRSGVVPSAPQAAPPRPPPSTRSVEKGSLNSSVVRDSKSLNGVGERSITFHSADAEADAVGNASKVSAGRAAVSAAAPPRVPSRFGALRVDSDSDSN